MTIFGLHLVRVLFSAYVFLQASVGTLIQRMHTSVLCEGGANDEKENEMGETGPFPGPGPAALPSRRGCGGGCGAPDSRSEGDW